MPYVSEETCKTQTGKILKAVGEIHIMIERHLGEHDGKRKADIQSTNRVRRIATIVSMVFGGLSLVGMAIMGCVKIVQIVGG